MKAFLIKLHQWALTHPQAARAIHAIWETALAVFVAGLTPVVHLIANHQYNDAKTALYGLIVGAGAAALSKAKSQLWPQVISWASSNEPHVTLQK